MWRPNYAAISSVLTALLFAAAGRAAQPTATPSGRTWQSDGSAADVQKIHDRQASDGDTIVIPKGTFSWTSEVRLTKAITLKGQTIRNDDGTSIDNTNIQDNIPRSTKKGLITLSAPGGQRITGISFVQGSITQNGQNGMIRIQGTTPTRIDHCVFDHLYWSPYVMVNDYNWGVTTITARSEIQLATKVYCISGRAAHPAIMATRPLRNRQDTAVPISSLSKITFSGAAWT